MDNVLCMNEQEYQKLDREIKRSMKRTAAEVVRLGYFLRRMHDERLYLVHYSDFDSYVREELHIDYSKANRFMNINKKYSFNGNSMSIDEKYEEYSQSLLEEMLNMPEELEEKVTSDMSTRQVREIKRQAKQQEQGNIFDVDYMEVAARQEQVVAAPQEPVNTEPGAGLQEELIVEIEEDAATDPEEDELSIEFDTNEFLCDLDSVIDAEYREVPGEEAVTAPQRRELAKPSKRQAEYLEAFARHFISKKHDWMLKDFHNRVLNVGKSPQEIKDYLGPDQRTWYFRVNEDVGCINMFDDHVQLWYHNGQYCMGDVDWFYLASAIERMWNVVALEEAEAASPGIAGADKEEDGQNEMTEPGRDDTDELQRIRGILEKERELLNGYLEVGGIPEPTVYRQKIIVGSLENMLYGLESEEEKEAAAVVQQELPVLKNNNQRKQWLSEYSNWGLWYRDENIDVNYYKFDFPDGSRLVVAEYPQRLGYWKAERTDEHYFHLLERNKMGYQTRYDEQYRQQTDSETYLVEFLKNVQKKGNME